MSLLLRGSPQEVSAGRGLEGVSLRPAGAADELKRLPTPSLLAFYLQVATGWPLRRAMDLRGTDTESGVWEALQVLETQSRAREDPGGVRLWVCSAPSTRCEAGWAPALAEPQLPHQDTGGLAEVVSRGPPRASHTKQC